MSKKESLVEDTFIQIKNLENVINENAKGILASTMKEEIKDLVKESLQEQSDEDEDEVEDIEVSDDDTEVDFDSEESDDESEDEMEIGDMSMDMEDEDEFEMDSDEDEMEPIDLTNASDEEILKVFKAMGDEDGIIVKKDDNKLHLEDENADVGYLIDLGESEEEKMNEEDDDELYSQAIDKRFEKEVDEMGHPSSSEGVFLSED